MSNVLFISRWFPYPTSNGSKLRIFQLLRALAEQHTVTLVSFVDDPRADVEAPPLRILCRAVEAVPWRDYAPDSQRARMGFLSSTPRAYLDTHSTEMEVAIRRAVATARPDLIIASQIDMASYVSCWDGIPAIFEEVELAFLYEQAKAAPTTRQRLRYGLTWAKHRRYLQHILRGFQACTVVSPQEQRLLAQAAPNFSRIEVIPNCIELASYDDVLRTPERNTLIFTGSFTYRVNYDAVVWFLREVYPKVQAQAPDVQLIITGNHANLPLPEASHVTLTGLIPEIRPLIANSWVDIVPLWQGGGTRFKILEAMALGTPVVSTSKGAEGLQITPDEHVLIADTPTAFADAVVNLLQDAGLRERLAGNAYRQVARHYNWPAVMPRFLQLVESVINS